MSITKSKCYCVTALPRYRVNWPRIQGSPDSLQMRATCAGVKEREPEPNNSMSDHENFVPLQCLRKKTEFAA